MTKAFWKTREIVVYIHEDESPRMRYNAGKLVVSKEPNSKYVFCVAKEELEIQR